MMTIKSKVKSRCIDNVFSEADLADALEAMAEWIRQKNWEASGLWDITWKDHALTAYWK